MQFEGKEVVICHGVVDLRKGALGLMALVTDAELGKWYLFSNRSRSLIKCVLTDKQGVWLSTRRLNQGHFHWLEKATGVSTISVKDASVLCNGGTIKKRFSDK